MAIYATGSQFTGAAAKPKDQNAQARDYLRQQGQAAPQQNNYAGSRVREKPVAAGTPMPQRTQITHGGQPTQAGSTRNKPVRQGVMNPAGGLGRPATPTNPGPVVQQQPQVRDRAFSMSEQQYRQGGAPTQVAQLAPAPAAIGTTVTMAGPGANQPNLAGMLGVGALNNITNTNQAAGLIGSANMAVGTPLPAYSPTGQETNPVAGLSVLGPNAPTEQGGAGTAGDTYDQVQTRIDSQWSPITPKEMIDQDADAARRAWGAIKDGPGGKTVVGEVADEMGLTRDDVAQFGSQITDPSNWHDVLNPPDDGNQSPFTSFAEWMATMIGEPFGAAATKLNEYGRQTKDAYYKNWEDLAPLQDVGLQLMDPRYTEAYENAARARMQTSIGQERDQAARDLMGQAGRGGAIGTGRETGINNAALRAMMEGEQRLLEDSFRRKLASQQLGAGIYGDAQRAKYGALEGGDISPGELAGVVLPFAADVIGSGAEALGGAMGDGPGFLPFFDLFLGG